MAWMHFLDSSEDLCFAARDDMMLAGICPVSQRVDLRAYIIRRWSEDDAEAYLKHIDVVRMLRAREEWRLELGWLETQGVDIPAAMRPLCYVE